jgi:hypothetical protein
MSVAKEIIIRRQNDGNSGYEDVVLDAASNPNTVVGVNASGYLGLVAGGSGVSGYSGYAGSGYSGYSGSGTAGGSGYSGYSGALDTGSQSAINIFMYQMFS